MQITEEIADLKKLIKDRGYKYYLSELPELADVESCIT